MLRLQTPQTSSPNLHPPPLASSSPRKRPPSRIVSATYNTHKEPQASLLYSTQTPTAFPYRPSTMPWQGAPMHVPQGPALFLYPNNDSFVPKMISLVPSGNRVKIGRQTNAKTMPGERNGYFDSKVLSRQHAEVWEEGGKVLLHQPRTLSRG
jgi:hypothetical protein